MCDAQAPPGFVTTGGLELFVAKGWVYKLATTLKERNPMNRPVLMIVASLLLVLAAVPAGARANLGGVPGSCDKACLRGMADAYFPGLVALFPSDPKTDGANSGDSGRRS